MEKGKDRFWEEYWAWRDDVRAGLRAAPLWYRGLVYGTAALIAGGWIWFIVALAMVGR